MKEKLNGYISKIKVFWQKRTKSQKGIFIGSTIAVIALIITIGYFTSKSNFTPLYNNLSMQEANQIKTELDARGIPYELENGGKTINVPETEVDNLLVELAGQGIPSSGNIDYSFFSENTSWGITDNEFSMLKLDAMQTELANLIKGIDGIQDAQVMINIPKDPLFVNEETEPASASIVLHTEPGYQFEGNQINALYTLVSKAVPNLAQENIAIMNQYFEYFDLDDIRSSASKQDAHTYQQSIKKDVERDLQRRVQQMLATMVGSENVVVSVTADIDFTQENRVEEIVEPIDEENMEGLPVSIERIQETYSGNPDEVGGITGTGEEDIAGYQGIDETADGDYELVKETINNEFNRIQKEIVESPYKIRDLGIQVAVNNVRLRDGENIEYLTAQEQNVVEEGIASILESMVQTSIDKTYENDEVGEDVINEGHISVVFQEFTEKPLTTGEPSQSLPTWVYFVGGGLLLLVIILIILLVRRKRASETEMDYVEDVPMIKNEETSISDIEIDQNSDQVVRRKQLEKMAKEKPEEFAKLLRSWIGEE